MIDVIITAIRREFLSECINSIACQAHDGVHIHIIKDGQCEYIDNIVSAITSLPISIYSSTKNIGPYRLVNCVMPFLKHKYFCIQDADDVSAPHRLKYSLQQCETNNLDMFGGSIQMFGDKEDNKMLMPQILCDEYVAPNTKRSLLFAHPTLFMRREYFVDINGYTDYYCGCDIEFMTRCYWAGAKINTTNDVLVHHRMHPSQLTKQEKTKIGSRLRRAIQSTLHTQIKTYPDNRNNISFFKKQGKLDACLNSYNLIKCCY